MKQLKTYSIYLKSHTEAPDYENTCYAESKWEAIEIFLKELGEYGWDKDMIKDNVYEGEK